MAEMFGAPVGISNAEQDMARMAMTQAQIGHMGVQDAMAPLKAEQTMAATALARSQAAKLDTAAITDESRSALIATRARIAQMDELGRAVRGVSSPETLMAALQAHEQASGEQTGLLDQQGQLLPGAAQNWEALRDEIQQRALSEKDRIAADYRERALKSAEKERKSRQDARTFWQDMDKQEQRAAAQARGRGARTGVVDTLAKTDGVKLGTDFMTTQFAGLEPAQARIYGRRLSERALQMRQKHPALTPSDAIKEAFNALGSEGAFKDLKRNPKSASPSNPLPLPADGKLESLKVGQYYTNGKQTQQWLGPAKGWATVGKIRGAPSMPQIVAEPEDDMEDENGEAEE